jgi:hypothetical protein
MEFKGVLTQVDLKWGITIIIDFSQKFGFHEFVQEEVELGEDP